MSHDDATPIPQDLGAGAPLEPGEPSRRSLPVLGVTPPVAEEWLAMEVEAAHGRHRRPRPE